MGTPYTTEAATDPVSALLKWVWEQLDADTSLTELIRPGNRHKFDTADQNIRPTLSPADNPGLTITIPTMTIVGLTSADDLCNLVLRLMVTTDSYKFHNNLPTILWKLTIFVSKLSRLSPNLGAGISFEKFGQQAGTLGYISNVDGKSSAGHAATVDVEASFTINRGTVYV